MDFFNLSNRFLNFILSESHLVEKIFEFLDDTSNSILYCILSQISLETAEPSFICAIKILARLIK